MGFIRSNFLLISGMICGIYIGQNYKIPNVKKLVTDAINKVKAIEAEKRKPDA